MILANGCNITKSEKFKGVWILSVPTVYEKVFAPLPVFVIFCIFVTLKIQIIKQIVILHKDNPSKYKMQFWNNDFIY